MRQSARVSWGSLVLSAMFCSACSRDSSVQAADQPSGFLPSSAPVEGAVPTSAPAANTTENTVAEKPRSPAATAAANELALASATLHQTPQNLAKWLETQKTTLPENRRSFALACATAAAGALADAKELAKQIDVDALAEDERGLLANALGTANVRAVAASFGAEKPLARAVDMLLTERDARSELAANHMPNAAKLYSSMLIDELDAPWEGDRDSLAKWTEALARAQRAVRWNAHGAWPSLEVKVQSGDSLVAIRKRVLKDHPDLVICTGLIEKSNELRDERALRPGDVLRVPTDRPSVFVDVSSKWLLYKLGDDVAAAFEIGVGKDGHDTPLGDFKVGEKTKNPLWYRPGAEPVPFGDPENPLGTRWIRWIRLDGTKTDIGFHGTNEEQGVGGRVSHGCVRLRNVDAELLSDILPEGAAIHVQM